MLIHTQNLYSLACNRVQIGRVPVAILRGSMPRAVLDNPHGLPVSRTAPSYHMAMLLRVRRVTRTASGFTESINLLEKWAAGNISAQDRLRVERSLWLYLDRTLFDTPYSHLERVWGYHKGNIQRIVRQIATMLDDNAQFRSAAMTQFPALVEADPVLFGVMPRTPPPPAKIVPPTLVLPDLRQRSRYALPASFETIQHNSVSLASPKSAIRANFTLEGGSPPSVSDASAIRAA